MTNGSLNILYFTTHAILKRRFSPWHANNIPREDLDVRINVHSNTFEVHKTMLIRSSVVFKGMLERNIKENNSSNLITAKITQVSFKALINYLNSKPNENDIFKYCDV